MKISLQPTDNTTRLAHAMTWLTRLLEAPTLAGTDIPSSIRGYIYIDDIPHQISPGTWQISDNIIYCGRNAGTVEPLTKLAILTCIANMTGALENTAIADKITARLTQVITDSARSVYAGFIRATQRPSRLAVDQVNCRVAVYLNDGWFLTNGTPVEVNDTWIVMDF